MNWKLALRALWQLRESLVFQLGAWGLTIALCLALTSALRERSRTDALRDELALPGLELRNLPLRKDDYLAVRERLGRKGEGEAVTFSAADDSLVIKAKEVRDYAAWRIAVADAMLSMPGAVWTVKKMCAGEKCPEAAYSVTLTAQVRNLAVTTPRNEGAAPSLASAQGPAVAAAKQ